MNPAALEWIGFDGWMIDGLDVEKFLSLFTDGYNGKMIMTQF